MPEDKTPQAYYIVSIEKVLVTPNGNASLQSFTGLVPEEKIRNPAFHADIIDVIDNYPPENCPAGARLAT